MEQFLRMERFSSASDDSNDFSVPSPKRARRGSVAEGESDASIVDADPQSVADQEHRPTEDLPSLEPSSSESDDNDDFSVPSPKRVRRGSVSEREIGSPVVDADPHSVADLEPRAAEGLPSLEAGEIERVKPESETDQISNAETSRSVDGEIPLPESAISRTLPELTSASVEHTQDDRLMVTQSTMSVPNPHPMTLSLSPPAMPSGRVPQPAGVLLLPLYSSTPTEPGEQSSLMVLQPHQLANFPFAVGGQMISSFPPVLTPSIDPLVPNASCPPAVYTLPLASLNNGDSEAT